MNCEVVIYSRRLSLFLFSAVLLGWTCLLSAQTQSQPSLSASLPYGAFFPANRWIPLELRLSNPTSRDINGYIAIPSGGRQATEFRLTARVPARSRVHQLTLVYFSSHTDPNQPLATLQWYDAGGGVVARNPIAGKSLDTSDANDPSRFVLSVNQRSLRLDNNIDVDATSVLDALATMTSYPLGRGWLNTEVIPRQSAIYNDVQAVILDDVDLSAIDAAQQSALLSYVRNGGTLVLPAPGGQSDPRGTWLEPYFPVQIIGHRQAANLPMDHGQPLKMAGTLPITEAVMADEPPTTADNADHPHDTLVLSGGGYVHIAYRTLGTGRIIFTSFPIGSLTSIYNLEEAQASAHGALNPIKLWAELLRVNEQPAGWEHSQLAGQQTALLQRMIGKSAPPWGMAVTIVAGYLILILIAQIFVGGNKRPIAFAITVLIAAVLTLGLLLTRMIGSRHEPFMAASLATLTASPAGGGTLQQSIAYVGMNDPDMALTAEDSHTVIRPLIGQDAAIDLPLFTIPRAGVLAERVDRIWQTNTTLPQSMRITATGQFGPHGLELSIDNPLPDAIEAPILATGRFAISLDQLPAGQSQATAATANPSGSFVNASVFTSDTAKLRGNFIRAMLTPAVSVGTRPRSVNTIELIGWLKPSATLQVVKTSATTPPIVSQQAAVIIPVQLHPAATGTDTFIPSAFTQIASVGPIPLYDIAKNEWIESRTPGNLTVAFERPDAAAHVTLQRGTLELDIDAPQYNIRIAHRGVPNNIIAQWNNPVGPQPAASFDILPGDVDKDGRIVLELIVESTEVSGTIAIQPPWQVKQITLSLRGKAE